MFFKKGEERKKYHQRECKEITALSMTSIDCIASTVSGLIVLINLIHQKVHFTQTRKKQNNIKPNKTIFVVFPVIQQSPALYFKYWGGQSIIF